MEVRILYNTKKGEIYTEKVNQALETHNKITNFHDLRVQEGEGQEVRPEKYCVKASKL